MERNEFLSKLGIGFVVACAGCGMASCGGGSKSDNPTPSTGTTTPPASNGGVLATADLNSELTAVGTSKVSNGIIIVRLATGNVAASFTAVQVACTHEGNSIAYNTAQGKFICPAHGSQFSTNGALLLRPAALPLKGYNVAISGTSLSVS